MTATATTTVTSLLITVGVGSIINLNTPLTFGDIAILLLLTGVALIPIGYLLLPQTATNTLTPKKVQGLYIAPMGICPLGGLMCTISTGSAFGDGAFIILGGLSMAVAVLLPILASKIKNKELLDYNT